MAEPKLPKIKPGIQPKKAMGSSGVKIGGSKIPIKKPVVENVTTKNLFTNIQRRNPEIRNVRGARTLTNMMSTFGTPQNEKIIRKNLQLLRNSLVETFEIAKLLRTALGTVGDGVGGKGKGAAKGFAIAGLGAVLTSWWAKTFGKKDDDKGDGSGQGFDFSTVASDLGQDVKESIEGVAQGLSNLGDDISERVEGITDAIGDKVGDAKDFIGGLSLPNLEDIGTTITGALSAITGILNFFNPLKFGEQLAKSWFGKKDDKEVAQKEDTADVDAESDTSATTASSGGQEIAQVASTDLSGVLNNSKSPLEGLNAAKFKPPKKDDKDKKKLNLSDEDYKELAYGVSGEAGPGKDKAAVAASILNRTASKNFPDNIKDVVHAKTKDGAYEYEALTKGTAFHSKELADFLKSDEGQKQIIEALETLQGRTDFKGQSQLKNRVPSEDPMLDPKGNFYHYFWQGGDGRVKPKDWQMPNYQKFINQSKIDGKKEKDISSILPSDGKTAMLPLVIGGNAGKVSSPPGPKSAVVNSSAPSTNAPTMMFLSSSNGDSSNLPCKSICNIMSG